MHIEGSPGQLPEGTPEPVVEAFSALREIPLHQPLVDAVQVLGAQYPGKQFRYTNQGRPHFKARHPKPTGWSNAFGGIANAVWTNPDEAIFPLDWYSLRADMDHETGLVTPDVRVGMHTSNFRFDRGSTPFPHQDLLVDFEVAKDDEGAPFDETAIREAMAELEQVIAPFSERYQALLAAMETAFRGRRIELVNRGSDGDRRSTVDSCVAWGLFDGGVDHRRTDLDFPEGAVSQHRWHVGISARDRADVESAPRYGNPRRSQYEDLCSHSTLSIQA